MDKKLWLVVRVDNEGLSEVLGLYDNREAAYKCINVNDYCTVIALHHYPVQSTYDPEYDSEYEDPTDYIGMGWVDSRGRP